MNTTHTQIQKQDELAIEAMSDELRSLIYYGLCALRVDLDRTEISASLYSIESTVKCFRKNVRTATDNHIQYMKSLSDRIKQPLSLVNSFADKI